MGAMRLVLGLSVQEMEYSKPRILKDEQFNQVFKLPLYYANMFLQICYAAYKYQSGPVDVLKLTNEATVQCEMTSAGIRGLCDALQ